MCDRGGKFSRIEDSKNSRWISNIRFCRIFDLILAPKLRI